MCFCIFFLFYTNRNKYFHSVQKKKHRLLNDKKKKHERENLHKQMKTSEQDAKDFGIACVAWEAAN
jgi:hypothetical protein